MHYVCLTKQNVFTLQRLLSCSSSWPLGSLFYITMTSTTLTSMAFRISILRYNDIHHAHLHDLSDLYLTLQQLPPHSPPWPFGSLSYVTTTSTTLTSMAIRIYTLRYNDFHHAHFHGLSDLYLTLQRLLPRSPPWPFGYILYVTTTSTTLTSMAIRIYTLRYKDFHHAHLHGLSDF